MTEMSYRYINILLFMGNTITKERGFLMKVEIRKQTNGITLIVLVITIIVLLILARSKYSNANSGQMDY